MTTRLLLKASSHWPHCNSKGVTCKGATCAKDVEQLTLKERFDLASLTLNYRIWMDSTHIPPSQPDTQMRHFNLYHAWRTLDHSQIIHPKTSTELFQKCQHQRIERRHQYTEKRNQILQQCFQRTGQGKTKHLPHALPELSRREKVPVYLARTEHFWNIPITISQHQYNTDFTGSAWWKNWGQKRCRTCLQGKSLFWEHFVIRPTVTNLQLLKTSPSEKEENQLSGYSPSSDCAPSVQNQPCIGSRLQQSWCPRGPRQSPSNIM